MDSLDLSLFKKTDEWLKELEESKPDLAELLIFFADRREAEWAFDLMRWTLETLGVTSAEDVRFAITLPQDRKRLRLIFCNHPVLDFSTYNPSGSKVGLLLLADQAAKASIDNSALEWTPKQTDELSKIHFYQLPIDLVTSVEFTEQFYKPSLEHTAKKFVNWTNGSNFRKFNVSKIAQAVFSLEKRRELLNKVIDQIQTEEYMISPVCPFTPTTFELLAELHATPKKTIYLARKDEFRSQLEEPFQKLFRRIATQLSEIIKEQMETERKIFARIPKNDFSHGGAWDFYWGAFYSKGGKRIEDAQLFMWMNHERLEVGFYIGLYGSNQRQQFLNNCHKHYETLLPLLKESLSDERLWLGSRDNSTSTPWQQWLQDPGKVDIHVSLNLPKQELLKYSSDELTDQFVQLYQQLFPLVHRSIELIHSCPYNPIQK